MHLECRFFATYRAIVGQKSLDREVEQGATVAEVLSTLEAEYPDLERQLLDEDEAIRPQLSILKNGRDVTHMDGSETVLEDGDSLSVFPPVAGGAGEVV